MAEASEAQATISEASYAGTSIAVPRQEPIAPVESAIAPAPEMKLPPAPQLAEPAPSAVPPQFLREHENRPVGPRRPPQPKPAPPRVRPAANETRKSRFPLLAATLAIAAGLGGAAGAIGVPTVMQLALGPASERSEEPGAGNQGLKALTAQLTTDVAALRTAVEQSTKLTAAQFGKITDRIERAEHTQGEPAARIAKIAETLERMERRAASPSHADVTGSVTVVQPPQPEPKPKPAIIDDYVVRKVFDGVALVEGRRGIIEVEPGSTLPGAGRVEEIRRQDGRWVVVTNKGLIVSAR